MRSSAPAYFAANTTPGPLAHATATLSVPVNELSLLTTAAYVVAPMNVLTVVSIVLTFAEPPTASEPAGHDAVDDTTSEADPNAPMLAGEASAS